MSSFCSRYHKWFVDLGYPQLDIVEYQDGSWDIIEMLNSPVIPSLTKYNTILGNMKNIIPTLGFCEKYCKSLDVKRREFWVIEDRKSAEAETNSINKELRAVEMAEKASQAVLQNPSLMERIATNGMQEMNLDRIARHIPKSSEKFL